MLRCRDNCLFKTASHFSEVVINFIERVLRYSAKTLTYSSILSQGTDTNRGFGSKADSALSGHSRTWIMRSREALESFHLKD